MIEFTPKTVEALSAPLLLGGDEQYNTGMTLIIGALTKDYVVIAGDGNATNKDNILLKKRDFQKIYYFDKTLHFGFAANGVSLGELIKITNDARKYISLIPPFKVEEKAKEFGDLARDIFINREKDFSIDFIFGGFDHNEEDVATIPRLFFISTSNDYVPTHKQGRQLYYAPENVPNTLSHSRLRNEGDYLARLLTGALKSVNSVLPIIGGVASCVIISKTDNKWFTYDLDKSNL